VAVLCEGDPLFYGSYLHLHARLVRERRCVVIPGITSFAGCAARAGLPLVSTNHVFSVVPGTLPEPELERRLRSSDAIAIIKLGRNFAKVRRVLDNVGRASQATFIEHGTTTKELVLPLRDKLGAESAYFSLILVPQLEGEPLPSEAGCPLE
jgi:precorrin-2 C(20)-methyltransferase